MICIYCLILIGVVAMTIGHLRGRWHEKRTRVVEIVKLDRNTEKAAKQLGKAIKERAWVCQLDVCLSPPFIDKYGMEKRELRQAVGKPGLLLLKGELPYINNVIRACHRLGIELYLQQEDTDLPAEECQKELSTNMRPEYRDRKINYIYPYNKKIDA